MSLGLGLGVQGGTVGGGTPLIENMGDGAYSWHTGPLIIKTGDDTYFGSIATDGTKSIQVEFDDAGSVSSFDVRTSAQDDDHNAPAISYDDATGYLYVASTDHNDGATDEVYIYRSTSGAVADLVLHDTLTINSPTYCQLYRNPADVDQVDLWTRSKSSGINVWGMTRTEDNFATEARHLIFRDHYTDSIPSLDGLGVWLIPNGIPLANYVPTITCLFHRFSDDALLASGSVAVSDIKTGMATIGNNGQSRNPVLGSSQCSGSLWSGGMTDGGTSADKDGGDDVTAGDIDDAFTYQDVTLDNSKNYVTSMWLKGNIAGTIGVRIPGFTSGDDAAGMTVNKMTVAGSRSTFTSADAGTLSGAVAIALTTSWVRYEFPAQTGDVATKNRVLLEGRDSVLGVGATNGLEVFADKVQIEEGTAATSGIKTGSTGPNVGGTPTIVADANDQGHHFRLLDAWQFESGYIEFLWAQFDGLNGCDLAGLDNQDDCNYYYGRLNTSTWLMEEVNIVGKTGDGLDVSSHTYVGGGCILAPRKVLIAQNNLAGDGKGRLRKGTSGGSDWSLVEVLESDDVVMRPVAPLVQTAPAGVPQWRRTDDEAWYLEGTYTAFLAGFDLDKKRVTGI